MSTRLTLDFDKIRESAEPLPDIGVADFIPLKADGQVEHPKSKPVKGIVLELNKPQALRRGIELPAGPGILYVRLPTGETLAERIEVEASQGQTTGKLTLRVAGRQELVDFPAYVAEIHPTPRRAAVPDSLRARSDPSDRSRWSTVKFDHFEQRPGRKPPNLSSFLEPFASQVVSERQGNRGIAKLQSSAGTFRPAHSVLDSRVHFESSLVGQVQAAKPTKLYGPRDELHAQWRMPLSTKRRRHVDEEQQERYFALSFEAEDEPRPLQVACVPGRWRTLADESARLTVQYVSDQLRNNQRGPRVVVGVDDPKFRALLQFMQTGDLASSVSLLVQAERALYEKFLNPYAAAAGGYVLTYAGYHDWHDDWGHWLHNLATRFPALPDGHILLANLILQGPESAKEQIPGYSPDQAWELALGSVLESVRRGPPMYRFGLRMLSSSIAILNHLVGAGHAERRRLNAAAKYVRSLSVRVDRHQPFCVFDVSRNAP
ncbi:hypothetical protein PI87_20465 [Ralstonia sp. A12]|uniref:hypothetical protein n=1 Tax=Ralstonia sp. A12 TaxID=1217052 RepID=UPI000573E722|nr:hypothetical protein [Ralstonia sp. A12]KHK51920.1 hypothetical protein PI87_20465 [Ralstonia sp. A12]